MRALDTQMLSVLVIIALAASAVLAIVCVVLVLRIGALRRHLLVAFPDGPTDAVEELSRQKDEISAIRDDVATVHSNAERLHEGLQSMLSRVGLVRYDAFEDVAGGQSFSAALLDLNGNGVVISAINGRHETRCYGKQIVEGKSQHTLSDEEAAAITSAIEGRPVMTLPQAPRKRRST